MPNKYKHLFFPLSPHQKPYLLWLWVRETGSGEEIRKNVFKQSTGLPVGSHHSWLLVVLPGQRIDTWTQSQVEGWVSQVGAHDFSIENMKS